MGSASGSGAGIYEGNEYVATQLYLKYNTIVLNQVGPISGSGGAPGSGGTGGWGQLVSGIDGSPGATGAASVRGSGGGIRKLGDVTVSLGGVILSGNDAASGPDCYGTFLTNDGNLIGNSGNCTITWLAYDLHDGTASPVNLGPLVINWLAPLTHAVRLGSVALNHIPYGVAGCGDDIDTDARGYLRPMGGGCEVGAFEAQLMFFLPFVNK